MEGSIERRKTGEAGRKGYLCDGSSGEQRVFQGGAALLQTAAPGILAERFTAWLEIQMKLANRDLERRRDLFWSEIMQRKVLLDILPGLLQPGHAKRFTMILLDTLPQAIAMSRAK